jgi:hypothetical protein
MLSQKKIKQKREFICGEKVSPLITMLGKNLKPQKAARMVYSIWVVFPEVRSLASESFQRAVPPPIGWFTLLLYVG